MSPVRKLMVPLLAAVALVAAAAPGLAFNEGFQGRYYATWNELRGSCGDLEGAVKVRYLSETRRRYNPAGPDRGVVLRYQAGDRQPWQWIGADGGIALRYRAGTDSLRGVAWEAECTWRVILGRSDKPSG